MNPATFRKKFKRIDPFPGGARTGVVCFTVGTNAYVGLGINGTTCFNDFYKFDGVSETWTRLPDYPSEFNGRYGATYMKYASNEIWVGLGRNGVADYFDWFAFNPSSETWNPYPNTFSPYLVGSGYPNRFVTAFTLSNTPHLIGGLNYNNDLSSAHYKLINRYLFADSVAGVGSYNSGILEDNINNEVYIITPGAFNSSGMLCARYRLSGGFATNETSLDPLYVGVVTGNNPTFYIYNGVLYLTPSSPFRYRCAKLNTSDKSWERLNLNTTYPPFEYRINFTVNGNTYVGLGGSINIVTSTTGTTSADMYKIQLIN